VVGSGPRDPPPLPARRRELRRLLRALQRAGSLPRGGRGRALAAHPRPGPGAARGEGLPRGGQGPLRGRTGAALPLGAHLPAARLPRRGRRAHRLPGPPAGHRRAGSQGRRRLRRAHLRGLPLPEPRLAHRGGGGALRGGLRELAPLRPGGHRRALPARGPGRRGGPHRSAGRAAPPGPAPLPAGAGAAAGPQGGAGAGLGGALRGLQAWARRGAGAAPHRLRGAGPGDLALRHHPHLRGGRPAQRQRPRPAGGRGAPAAGCLRGGLQVRIYTGKEGP
jgi:hypothetical protein